MRWTVFFVAAVLVIAFFSAAVNVAVELNGRRPATGVLAVFAVVAAAGFHPTRVALLGVVDRLLFGDRADPVAAASHVGSRLSDDPVIALRALREALAIPHAALVTDGEVVATSGTATTATTAVPLTIGPESVGELVVGLRPGQVALAGDDVVVLRIIAPAIAQVVYARSLARELQESRSAVISAVEDERRRLRRDLHDGLGPTLTGVAYAADAARNMIADDPARADALLAGLRSDTAGAITDIRRLIEGLRPPALDELGLVRALQQQTAHMLGADGMTLQVSVAAPEPMPELPAAVEVAAYRIVLEALTNVAKHARCHRAAVELDLKGDQLTIEIRDTGRSGDGGSAGGWQPGVGMSSMRDRARQLGGSWEAGATATGGRVRASIPVA